jgi:hypothetical protein
MAALAIQMHSETPRRAPSLKLTLAPSACRRSFSVGTSFSVGAWRKRQAAGYQNGLYILLRPRGREIYPGDPSDTRGDQFG